MMTAQERKVLEDCRDFLGDMIYFNGDDERQEQPQMEEYVENFGSYEARKIAAILEDIREVLVDA